MENKKKVTMLISIDIETNKSIEQITKALEKGIYRGLDTEPNYIASPKDVNINYCHVLRDVDIMPLNVIEENIVY